MMTRTLSIVALMLAVLFTGGCVKVKQALTVMPDGSGKMEFVMGISNAMKGQLGGEDPFEEFTIENMMEEELPDGIVAMSEPMRYEDGGYDFVTFTAYFNDINEVSFDEAAVGDIPFGRYTFEQTDAGCILVAQNGMVAQMLADYEKPDAQEAQMMQQMMQGMEIAEVYILPGECDGVDGVEMTDNTAEIVIDADNIVNATGPIAELDDSGVIELVVPENSIDNETVEAFQAELEAAIVAWEELKASMENE